MGRLTAHQKERANAPVFNKNKQETSAAAPNQTQKIRNNHHPVPVAASHQLSQIDFYFLHSAPWFRGIPRRFSCFFHFLAARCAPCSCAW
jgi:hypothetical protein